MKVDRYVGLQRNSAAQGELIEDLPDELYTTGPVYYEFREESEPDDFYERFCLKFLPWFYKNNPNAEGDQRMVDGLPQPGQVARGNSRKKVMFNVLVQSTIEEFHNERHLDDPSGT